jgi:uncharacterized membrane protein
MVPLTQPEGSGERQLCYASAMVEPSPKTILGPAARYEHRHPPLRPPHEVAAEGASRGQRIADRVTKLVGSWPFILTQSLMLVAWMAVNVWFALHPGALKAWDPYPFILLNLVLSFQAAYTGPIVMMSQNRQSEIDRRMALVDYQCNVKAEEEVRVLMEHLAHQDVLTQQLHEKLDELLARVAKENAD